MCLQNDVSIMNRLAGQRPHIEAVYWCQDHGCIAPHTAHNPNTKSVRNSTLSIFSYPFTVVAFRGSMRHNAYLLPS